MTQLVVYVFKEMRVRSEPPSEATKVDDLTSLEDCLRCASGVGCVVGASFLLNTCICLTVYIHVRELALCQSAHGGRAFGTFRTRCVRGTAGEAC